MSAPVRFAVRNLVWGARVDDVYAVYRLAMTSYEGLTHTGKLRLLAELAGLVTDLGADLTLQRVHRGWSAVDYRAFADAAAHPTRAHRVAWDEHLARGEHALAGRGVTRPEVYLAVRLTPNRDEVGLLDGWRGLLAEMRATVGLGDPVGISERRLRELAAVEARVSERVLDFVEAEPASTLDLQWLLRRGFTRGATEPGLDVHWRPQALVVLEGEEVSYRPLEADVQRVLDNPITRHDRHLEIATDDGGTLQALLAVGALPERVEFPGAGAELLFAPLEDVGFPVDAAVTVRHVPNQRAAALVRRRVVDADNEAEEQSHGDHGLTPDAARRPAAARALEDYLTGSERRPPLLHTTISLAVGVPHAAGTEELERRVEQLQRAYGTVRLHRPLGPGQIALFRQHFPAQPTQLPAYADYLLAEHLAAMVPTATHAVGSDRGPYLGHTLSGSRQPVCWDVTEGPREGLTPAMLMVGPPGRGKTATLQRLYYEAFLQGSRVIDLDPKPDHRWTLLPEVAAHTETIEFTADPAYRGALDPLRLAPAGEAEDLAVEWLLSLLRRDIPHAWETEIRAAVKDRLTRSSDRARPSCGDVLEALAAGNDPAREAGRALAVFADSGLAQLGFAEPRAPAPQAGARQVTLLRIAGLALPEIGTPLEQLSARERTSQGLLTLAATYALGLMAADPTVHTVLGYDECWVIVGTPAGRRLIRRANRLGRAQNGTPILATQTLADVDEELHQLIGAVWAFGAETTQEAARTLALLGQDHEDAGLQTRLVALRGGQCVLRDYRRRTGRIQVDFTPHPHLLDAFDTTPPAPERTEPDVPQVPEVPEVPAPQPARAPRTRRKPAAATAASPGLAEGPTAPPRRTTRRSPATSPAADEQ